MKLITTNTIFPGGWRYKQFSPDNRLLKEFKSMSPWNMFIDSIVSFRKQNRLARATFAEADEDAQDYLCHECGNDPHYCVTQKKTSSLRSQFLSRPVAAVAHAVKSVRKLAVGTNILRHWFGSGMQPVTTETAQARSDVCTGRFSDAQCPHNRDDVELQKILQPVSHIIKAYTEKKNELKLSVVGEDKLQSCALCLCPLHLKVWVPMETILNDTPQPMKDEFVAKAPSACWIRQAVQP